jgi:hypothetical protein
VGARQDLRDLENTCSAYPEAIVAISALYRDEILMTESYLVNNLRFNITTLNELTQQGEITKQETEDDYIFYGLPHTSLGKIYWACGKKYFRRRNIPEKEDFVYEYASTLAPNSLEVIVNSDIEELADRLNRSDSEFVEDIGKWRF